MVKRRYSIFRDGGYEKEKRRSCRSYRRKQREAGIQEVLQRAVAIVEVPDELERMLRRRPASAGQAGHRPDRPAHPYRAGGAAAQDAPVPATWATRRYWWWATSPPAWATPRTRTPSARYSPPEQVHENMRHYEEQIGMVAGCQTRPSSAIMPNGWRRWIWRRGPAGEPLHRGAMIQRENFQRALGGGHPIGLHELMYPLMQGYNSVATGQRCGNRQHRPTVQRDGRAQDPAGLRPAARSKSC